MVREGLRNVGPDGRSEGKRRASPRKLLLGDGGARIVLVAAIMGGLRDAHALRGCADAGPLENDRKERE